MNLSIRTARTINKSNKKSLFITKIITATIILLGLGILYIWEQAAVENVSMKVESLKQEKKSLINYTEFLKVEIETLSRFEKIEDLAKNKLQMEFSPEQPITLIMDNPEKKSGFFYKAVTFFRELIGRIY